MASLTAQSSGRSAVQDDVFKRYSIAIVTPFRDDDEQSIDEAGVAEVVAHTCTALASLRATSSDIGGIIVSGTTGEQHTMTKEERIKLYYTVIRYAEPFGVPVACGVSATTSKVAAELAEAAVAAGCHGIMLGLLPYVRCNDEELTSYVHAVRAVVPDTVPILLYNNVIRNGYSPSLEAIAQWYHSGAIYGMKYAIAPHADFVHNSWKMLGLAPALPMYTGSDVLIADFLKPGILAGASDEGTDRVYYGVTSVVGNIIPRYMGQAVLNLINGELREEGLEMHAKAASLATSALTGVSVPVGIKYSLNSLGIRAGVCRRPVGSLPTDRKAEIDRALTVVSGMQ
jgi:4-hydroxy-tetrahydrodipicolinate synthase